MAKQIQTTFTFSNHHAANIFCDWLKKNIADSDYGCPRLIDKRQVSAQDEWCVEYIYDNTKEGHLVQGAAMGIEFALKQTTTANYKCLSRKKDGDYFSYSFLAEDGESYQCESLTDDWSENDIIGVPVRDGIPQWHEKFLSAVRTDSQ